MNSHQRRTWRRYWRHDVMVSFEDYQTWQERFVRVQNMEIWLNENVGIRGLDWGIFGNTWEPTYSFPNPRHAVAFKLTWGFES